jgi:hypothetical protein
LFHGTYADAKATFKHVFRHCVGIRNIL